MEPTEGFVPGLGLGFKQAGAGLLRTGAGVIEGTQNVLGGAYSATGITPEGLRGVAERIEPSTYPSGFSAEVGAGLGSASEIAFYLLLGRGIGKTGTIGALARHPFIGRMVGSGNTFAAVRAFEEYFKSPSEKSRLETIKEIIPKLPFEWTFGAAAALIPKAAPKGAGLC